MDVGKFVGSVAATALVAAIAGWLIAWVVEAVFQRFGHVWANGGNTPTMYAIYGAVAAILAGVLWYLLLIGTANPRQFFVGSGLAHRGGGRAAAPGHGAVHRRGGGGDRQPLHRLADPGVDQRLLLDD